MNPTLKDTLQLLMDLGFKESERLISIDETHLSIKPEIAYTATEALDSKLFILRDITLLKNKKLSKYQEETGLNNYEFSALCYCLQYNVPELVILGKFEISKSSHKKPEAVRTVKFKSTGETDESEIRNAPLLDIIGAIQSYPWLEDSAYTSFENFGAPLKKGFPFYDGGKKIPLNRRHRRVFKVSEAE